jgi:hypothetical protein|tara:strand:+ start:5637 stop:6065 length:429 start_codon:yes stop_codon:yes gene_type:complete
MDLLLTPPTKPRELNEMQTSFLAELFTNGGDIDSALQHAGYKQGSKAHLIKTLRTEIIERAETMLAANSAKAASKLVGGMDLTVAEFAENPMLKFQVKTAESILDRVGVGKQEKLTVEGSMFHGVVLLPDKAPMQDITPEDV